MSQTAEFIQRLESLKEGERSRLRRLVGQSLDETLAGFDLFTGLWWPLRQANQAAPRRETSWLVAKLFGAFGVPHVPCERGGPTTLAFVLGSCEPLHPACRGAALLNSVPPEHEPARGQFIAARRYRRRFDALLGSWLPGLEPHLRWALSAVAEAVEKGPSPGLDWVQLLDDLSIWERGDEHRRGRDIRDIWAEEYLKAANETERR